MNIIRRHWILSIGLLIIIGLLAYAFAPRPVPVDLVRVTQGPLRVTVNEDGRTRIRERYIVSAPLGGQLRRLELHPGDKVEAGTTLIAVIEPSEPDLLDPRALAQLEARLRAAEAQAQLAGPRVERARVAHELAQIELTRAEKLAQQQAVAGQELDRAREAARGTAEDLKAAEYSRQIAGFEVEQARAALMRSDSRMQPNDAAWELRVTSPITGCVLRVFHEDAAVVAPGAALLELGDPADLEAVIDVLSSDAVRIRPDARVLFEHWGGQKPLEGRVRVIEPAGFLKISALGVEEQRVNVIADFVTPFEERRELGDAYRVEARIVIWEEKSVLKLPVGALFRNSGKWSVFAAKNGRAQLTTVEVGESNGRETQIVGGLVEGADVVVHPSDKVADGLRITERIRR
ncbi:MAG TPA: HlyD family efflux transporter periplasmic adaptor subunit [Opitutus sp.]|nr:HlyD family efflux transporter periplasmic adaptor subunit [Opitutus sp.]